MNNQAKRNWASVLQFASMATTYIHPAVGFATVTGAKFLINAFFTPEPKTMERSQAYTWDYSSNQSATRETPMPVVYGKSRVKPIVKNRFTRKHDNKEYLHILYGVTGHPIDTTDYETIDTTQRYPVGTIGKLSTEPGRLVKCVKASPGYTQSADGYYAELIGDPLTINYWEYYDSGGDAAITDIQINGSPINNFMTGNRDQVWLETRPGTADQVAIPGFEETHTNYNTDLAANDYFPAPDVTKAAYTLNTDVRRLTWNEHQIYYNSRYYTVTADYTLTGVLNNRDVRLWWNPSNPHTYSITVGEYSGMGDYFEIIKWTAGSTYDTSEMKYYPPYTDDRWVTLPTIYGPVQNIEVAVRFPFGLYELNQDNSIAAGSAKIHAQMRKTGSSNWSNFELSTDTFEAVHEETPSYGQLERKTSQAFTVRLTAKEDKWTELADTSANYEIRVSILSNSEARVVNAAAITYAEENQDGTLRGFRYPGEALIGLVIPASDELNGDIELTCVAERSQVWVADTNNNWSQKPATYHPWAIYDILTNGNSEHPDYPDTAATAPSPNYGLGVPLDDIDYTSLNNWAEYINGELGWRLNITFDTAMTAWDAIQMISREGRGRIFPVGAEYYAVVDRAVTDISNDSTTATGITQLFTEGNIVSGSFTTEWPDTEKVANCVEVSYIDTEYNYEKRTFTQYINGWDTTDELSEPLRLTLYGTTDYEQAVAIATYYLNCNELLRQTVRFETDIEGLGCMVGDIVRIQHPLLQSGYGGLLASVTTEMVPPLQVTLNLDQDVTLPSSGTWQLVAQRSDSTVAAKTVYNNGITTDEMEFNSYWSPSGTSEPEQYFPWALGDDATKAFRVLGIRITGENKCEITALEYDARVYKSFPLTQDTATTTAEKIAAGDYAPGADLTLTNISKIAPNLGTPELATYNTAEELSLQEIISRNRSTGEYEISILASWGSDNREWGEWDVSYRDVDADDPKWQGDWTQDTSYSTGDMVVYNNVTYISLADGNTSTPI